MIDIGFSKIILVGVVALVVVGPERLPKVARMAGNLFGRAQRYINNVKNEVSREMEMEELRKMQQDIGAAANDLENDLQDELAGFRGYEHPYGRRSDDAVVPAGPDRDKLRRFRQKKLAKTSGVPKWYKQQTGQRMQVMSASARVSKHRPKIARGRAGFF